MNFQFPQMEPRVVQADESVSVNFAVSPAPEESLGLAYRLGSNRTDAMKLDAKTGDFEYRERVTKDRIIAPAISAEGILLVYSTTGQLVALRPQ